MLEFLPQVENTWVFIDSESIWTLNPSLKILRSFASPCSAFFLRTQADIIEV